MKAKEFRKNANNKYTESPKKYNKFFKGNKEDDLKIIGITGSKGKSGVAYILNEYLKKLGYKTVMYSSIMIDSELSYNSKSESIETPLRDEQMLLDAVSEALDYEADYLILEINESTLNKHLIDNLDFDVRVLTNIVPKQNDIIYSNYVELKKSFFRTANKNETLIMGLVDPDTISLYNELKDKKIVTFSTEYLSKRYSLKHNDVDYYVNAKDLMFESINGINFNIVDKNKVHNFNSTLLFGYNALNIACVYSILNELKILDVDKLKEIIKNITIPGREEIIKTNGIKIIISLTCVPHLEKLKQFKDNGEVNEVIITTGASGYGYVNWHNEVNLEKYLEDKEYSMKFAYNYIGQYADKVYVTVTDIGAVNVDEWLDIQFNLLPSEIFKEKISDRKEAIRQSIVNANQNDIILVCGRGNRRIMCDGINHISNFIDKDIILEIIKDLGWEAENVSS